MFWPCETRTSTCRSFATISSGLYRFLAIAVLLDVKDIPQVGPLQWGWINVPKAILSIYGLGLPQIIKRTPKPVIKVIGINAGIISCLEENEVANKVRRQKRLATGIQRLENHLGIVGLFKLNDNKLHCSAQRLKQSKDALVALNRIAIAMIGEFSNNPSE